MQPTGFQAAERETYETVWGAVAQYADESPGEICLPLFLQMADRGTVLDAGTGSGKGALALAKAGFSVTCCDLTDEGLVAEARRLPFRRVCLWEPLRPNIWLRRFDYVYCCDVLEHIPSQFTMLAVARMLEVCKVGLFASVTLVPDNLGVWIGKPLHQTVQPFEWWRDSFGEIGDVVDARDLLLSAVYYVQPRG